MKTKYLSLLCIIVILTVVINNGCNELELKNPPLTLTQELSVNSRSQLSKSLMDSVNMAECKIDNRMNNVGSSNAKINTTTTLVNHALQATVEAESTFPGYSVQRIKDGSRTTTVGPSYS